MATGELAYLFDTGALIDIYRGRQRIRPFFDQVMDGKHQGAAELFSSWFVVHRFSGFWRASGAR
jgi:hypothetical protein